MKKFWKYLFYCGTVVLVSVGASYATFNYLNDRSSNLPSSIREYGHSFDQKNVRLASLTSDGYPDFTKSAEKSVHAVVHIKSTTQAQTSGRKMIDPFEYFFGRQFQQEAPQQQERVGFGSGVIISKDGYIITNNHVIDKATEIEVTLNDNSKLKAKLLGADPETDIALLKIEGKDFPYIPFGDSDNLKIGEWVLAVGNPFNLTSTVTAGIVSAKGRGGIGDSRTGGARIQSYIQTDAAINMGNSGGALVNTNGELIGINTAIIAPSGSFAGYGFAVPISIAGKVVADIKEFGAVQRGMLGVEMNDLSFLKEQNSSVLKSLNIDAEQIKNIKRNDGAYIIRFAEQSPAKQAGLEAGDIIIAVNDAPIRTGSELQEQVSRHRPGDKIKLTVSRNNAEKTFTITLKNSEGTTEIRKKEDAIATVGAAFKELTDEVKKEHGISYGVEVAGVDNQGQFHKEGISKGFIIQRINNIPVSTAEEVEKIIRDVANQQEKVLFISGFYPTTNKRMYYAVKLSE